jgi:hypothetical protein
MKTLLLAAVALGGFLAPLTGTAATPVEWIRVSEQVYGEFNTFIAIGIRIGLDALQRLDAKPGDVHVTYINGAKTPCACVADGVMIATRATPGREAIDVARVFVRPDLMGAVIVSEYKTGKRLRYDIAAAHLPKLIEWNKTLDPAGRYSAVMKLPDPYTVSTQGN